MGEEPAPDRDEDADGTDPEPSERAGDAGAAPEPDAGQDHQDPEDESGADGSPTDPEPDAGDNADAPPEEPPSTEDGDTGTEPPVDEGQADEAARDQADAEPAAESESAQTPTGDPTGDPPVDPTATADADDDGDGDAEASAADGEADVDVEGGNATNEGFVTSDGGETIPHYQSMPDIEDQGFGTPEGPAEDEEMPLTVHIEEMLKRLAVVIAVAGVVSIVTFPYAETAINFLWNSILPQGPTTRPRLYGILELTFTELKVASLAGLIVALPVLVYQTYRFMRPGLYPHERRYYLAAVPTSLVLALVGVSFAFFLFLPLLFGYFLGYSREVANIGFALGKTFDLILLMMGYLAVVFQIPLFIMLAMMMGLVTREWLAERRLLFWGAFLGVSFFIGVGDPTGAAPFLVAITMIVLFEGTLLLSKWTDRGTRADWA